MQVIKATSDYNDQNSKIAQNIQIYIELFKIAVMLTKQLRNSGENNK